MLKRAGMDMFIQLITSGNLLQIATSDIEVVMIY